MSDEDRPWWEALETPTFGDARGTEPLNIWSQAGLLFRSLTDTTKTCYNFSTGGNFKCYAKEWSERIIGLGCRLIYESHAIHSDTPSMFMFAANDSLIKINLIETADFTEPWADVYVATSNKTMFDELCAFVRERYVPPHQTGSVYVLSYTDNGPALVQAGCADVEIERGNYTESVIRDFDHIVKDLQEPSPCGRLIVLNGPPGTGKTFFVRGVMMAVTNCMFIIVQAHMIADLMGPQLIQPLLRKKNQERSTTAIVFIIEDGDACLLPRQGDNMHSISSLLNIGDGILGSIFDVRAIITTNAKKLEIDEALLRPGRICRISNIETLPKDKCNEIYERLTGKSVKFTEPHTLAELYVHAKAKGWPHNTHNDVDENNDEQFIEKKRRAGFVMEK